VPVSPAAGANLEASDELARNPGARIGHLQHRDVVTLLIDQGGWDALGAATFGLKAPSQLGRTLLRLSYSRGVETRADQSAIATGSRKKANNSAIAMAIVR